MTTISISQLKANPTTAISNSEEYPVAILKRNTVQAYVVGKALYEQMVALLEDKIDKARVAKTDFTQGRDFESVASEVGV